MRIVKQSWECLLDFLCNYLYICFYKTKMNLFVCRWKPITTQQTHAPTKILKQKKSNYSFDEVYSKTFFRPRFEYILEPRALPCDCQVCNSIQSRISVPFCFVLIFLSNEICKNCGLIIPDIIQCS